MRKMKTIYFIGGPADLTKMRVDDDLVTRSRIIKIPAYTVTSKPVVAYDDIYTPSVNTLHEYEYRLAQHPNDTETYLAFIVTQ